MSLFSPSTWFKSDAEKKVDAIYGAGAANTLNTDAQIFAAAGFPSSAPTPSDTTPFVSDPLFYGSADIITPADQSLGIWESVSRAVTPESYGESIVNQIYSNPAATLRPDPVYDEGDLSSPTVYVKAKGAVKSAVASAASAGTHALYVAVAILLLGVAVYALVPALVRRA